MAKEDVVKMPPVSVLIGLIAKSKAAREKSGTAMAGYREAVGHAVDEHNVHAGALRIIQRWVRMDAVKLMSELTHLDYMRDKLGIDKLAASDIPGLEEDPAPPRNRPGHAARHRT